MFPTDWLLLAQDAETVVSPWADAMASLRGFLTIAAIAAVLFGLPVFLGRLLARNVFRMGDDYSWRIALVLSMLFCTVAVLWPTGVLPKSAAWRGWPPKYGIDLKGGVILVYEMVDQGPGAAGVREDGTSTRVSVEDLIEPLRRRLDPGGVKEIVVRAYGQNQVEIIVPEVDTIEVDRIKDLISKAGHLEFRILVDQTHARDSDLVSLALEDRYRKVDLITRAGRDGADEPLAAWVRIARDERPTRIRSIDVPDPADPSKKVAIDSIRPLKVLPYPGYVIRDAETFELLDLPNVDWSENDQTHEIERQLAARGVRELDILVRMDDNLDVEGGDIEYAVTGFDQRGGPAVNFTMTGRGAKKMAALTSSHLPEGGREKYQMGIILDDEILTAPNINSTISDRGEISGSFTDDEVKFLVRILQGGRLPASLNKAPISENRIDPLLGQDTIFRSMLSMALALLVTLVFIIFWYRAAGLVATVALLLNLAFTLALLVLFSVALTLPGVAGLVLAVGMSVDANILIFERMREERMKGSSFRLAVRNGFNRATTTIIDSNLTTLITAFVLYFIGTDQIKGFAITLILGILTSMFTAIFVAKLIFEISERRGWMKDIYAFGAIQKYLVERGFDFVKPQFLFMIASLVLCAASLGLAFARGGGIFDIDFAGGTSVVALLKEPVPEGEIREMLENKFGDVRVDGSSLDYSLTQIRVATDDARQGNLSNRLYKVDSSYAKVEELKKALEDAFSRDGQTLLQPYSLKFTAPVTATRTVPVLGDSVATEVDDVGSGVLPADEVESDVPAETTPATPAPEGTTTPETPAAPAEEETTPPAESTPDEEIPAEPAPGSNVRLDFVASPYFVTAALQPPEGDAAPTDGEDTPTAELTPAQEPAVGEAPPPETPAPADAPSEPTIPGAPAGARPDGDEPDTVLPSAEPAPSGSAETASGAPGPSTPAAPGAETTPGSEAPVATEEVTESKSTITFEEKIHAAALIDRLKAAAATTGDPLPDADLDLLPVGEGAAEWNPASQLQFREWEVTLRRDNAGALAVLQKLEQEFSETYVFPSSSEIGGQVAGKTKTMAAFALLFSMIGIVLYIWFRFQKVVYGLAAVAALVHDVVITLGALALTYWLARYVPGMSALGIDEFKISLPVIAAFLTLMGYSLNDTIVVFDRIREVRGKSPYLDADMINRSINQTLSRTLLTSVTTFLSILILYFLGGEGIHAFSFCLIVGILVGTYSSIFIAAPIMLWMSARTEAPASKKAVKPPRANPRTT